MKHVVINRFKDLKDKDGHVYEVGDKFPHHNRKVAKARLEELMSVHKTYGYAFIEAVEEAEE